LFWKKENSQKAAYKMSNKTAKDFYIQYNKAKTARSE
jgi:hypothetical protein